MTSATATVDLLDLLRDVPAPHPVLDHERERQLTDRQRDVLDRLVELFNEGFSHLTMADLAARLNCSLRTLYGLAPSRDELVLAVVDRNLRSVGRTARDAIHSDMAPLEAIRHYLEAANVAVADTTEAFARDLATLPAGQRLSDQHSDYLVAVTRRLLDLAVERGDIDDVDTAAVARVTASLGRDLSRPDVFTTLRSTPKEAADAVLDLVLSGLTAHRA